MNVFAKCDEILEMILQDIKKTKGSIQKPVRITKGNNSNSWPLALNFYKQYCPHTYECVCKI